MPRQEMHVSAKAVSMNSAVANIAVEFVASLLLQLGVEKMMTPFISLGMFQWLVFHCFQPMKPLHAPASNAAVNERMSQWKTLKESLSDSL